MNPEFEKFKQSVLREMKNIVGDQETLCEVFFTAAKINYPLAIRAGISDRLLFKKLWGFYALSIQREFPTKEAGTRRVATNLVEKFCEGYLQWEEMAEEDYFKRLYGERK